MGGQVDRRERRRLRLRDYDYRRPAAYFLTVVTQDRRCLFGNVVDGEMHCNELGRVVAECWAEVPNHFAHATLDDWIVMPNHFHAIVVLSSSRVGARHASPASGDVPDPRKGALGAIVGSFKAAASRRIHLMQPNLGKRIWQRGYYDHIIRNERSLEEIRRYIECNPGRWAEDPENPANVRSQ